jgi:hypothetical protein
MEDGLVAGKPRVPMQVAPNFEAMIKELQNKIMRKQGEKISLRDITEKIEKNIDLNKLESDILKDPMAIKIRLDRRTN